METKPEGNFFFAITFSAADKFTLMKANLSGSYTASLSKDKLRAHHMFRGEPHEYFRMTTGSRRHQPMGDKQGKIIFEEVPTQFR